MSRFHSYINSSKKLIETYRGEKPFAIFLKQFFAANKKYGSKDRRFISALCYNYFRMGFAISNMAVEEKLLVATFLCEKKSSELISHLKPEWSEKISLSLPEKLVAIDREFFINDIFPFKDELSEGIDTAEFCKSFLVQPDLFIRVRREAKTAVLKKLEKSPLSFQLADEDCVRLNISENIEDFFEIDREVVVQDYNSQKVFDYLKNGGLQNDFLLDTQKVDLSVWDCCAASGGKSILLKDIVNRKLQLTVSDIRPGIILNLHQRLKKAGLKEYKYFIADISNTDFDPGQLFFDMIVCDAPCSGSGTWSRTPEQLCFFQQPSIEEYSSLQKKIIDNILPRLRKDGLFIYITCSVFKKENETIAAYIAERFNCTLIQLQLLKGYDKKADNMFVAVFRK